MYVMWICVRIAQRIQVYVSRDNDMKFNAKLCCYANRGHTYLQTSTNILYIKHTYVHTYMHVRQQWLSSRLENDCLRGKKLKKKA